MSSVSKYWIWHLLVSTTNRSLPYGQQKDCNCRIFVHMVCHLYFQSTETSNEMADTTRIPRIYGLDQMSSWFFLPSPLPPNATVSSSNLTSLSEKNSSSEPCSKIYSCSINTSHFSSQNLQHYDKEKYILLWATYLTVKQD